MTLNRTGWEGMRSDSLTDKAQVALQVSLRCLEGNDGKKTKSAITGLLARQFFSGMLRGVC